MKGIAAAAALAAAVAGYLLFRPGQKPDIREAKAMLIADKAMEEYCQGEELPSASFYFRGEEAPDDSRFKWAFKYVNESANPPLKLVVSVARDGEVSTTVVELPPPAEGTPAAEGAPAEGAAGAEAAPAGEPAPN